MILSIGLVSRTGNIGVSLSAYQVRGRAEPKFGIATRARKAATSTLLSRNANGSVTSRES